MAYTRFYSKEELTHMIGNPSPPATDDSVGAIILSLESREVDYPRELQKKILSCLKYYPKLSGRIMGSMCFSYSNVNMTEENAKKRITHHFDANFFCMCLSQHFYSHNNSLQYAPIDFQYAAVSAKPRNLQYTTNSVKSDLALVEAAVNKDPGAFRFASRELKKNDAFITEILRNHGNLIGLQNGKFTIEPEFVDAVALSLQYKLGNISKAARSTLIMSQSIKFQEILTFTENQSLDFDPMKQDIPFFDIARPVLSKKNYLEGCKLINNTGELEICDSRSIDLIDHLQLWQNESFVQDVLKCNPEYANQAFPGDPNKFYDHLRAGIKARKYSEPELLKIFNHTPPTVIKSFSAPQALSFFNYFPPAVQRDLISIVNLKDFIETSQHNTISKVSLDVLSARIEDGCNKGCIHTEILTTSEFLLLGHHILNQLLTHKDFLDISDPKFELQLLAISSLFSHPKIAVLSHVFFQLPSLKIIFQALSKAKLPRDFHSEILKVLIPSVSHTYFMDTPCDKLSQLHQELTAQLGEKIDVQEWIYDLLNYCFQNGAALHSFSLQSSKSPPLLSNIIELITGAVELIQGQRLLDLLTDLPDFIINQSSCQNHLIELLWTASRQADDDTIHNAIMEKLISVISRSEERHFISNPSDGSGGGGGNATDTNLSILKALFMPLPKDKNQLQQSLSNRLDLLYPQTAASIPGSPGISYRQALCLLLRIMALGSRQHVGTTNDVRSRWEQLQADIRQGFCFIRNDERSLEAAIIGTVKVTCSTIIGHYNDMINPQATSFFQRPIFVTLYGGRITCLEYMRPFINTLPNHMSSLDGIPPSTLKAITGAVTPLVLYDDSSSPLTAGELGDLFRELRDEAKQLNQEKSSASIPLYDGSGSTGPFALACSPTQPYLIRQAAEEASLPVMAEVVADPSLRNDVPLAEVVPDTAISQRETQSFAGRFSALISNFLYSAPQSLVQADPLPSESPAPGSKY